MAKLPRKGYVDFFVSLGHRQSKEDFPMELLPRSYTACRH